MKKLVIKTISITLASLIGAMLLVFCALVLFAPGYVGGVFDGAGNYSASVFFYEKQYEKTGSVKDLNTLVLKLDIDKDTEKAEKFYCEIINHADFDKLCQDNSSQDKVISEKEYYYGNYTLALAKNGKFSQALSFAKEKCAQQYSAFAPMRVLIYDYLTAENKEELVLVAQALGELNVSSNYIDIDLAYVQSLLN